MKRAILLAGFNNWGKTTHTFGLFGQSRFYRGHVYNIAGVNAAFTVEPRSNDDFGEQEFIQTVQDRINLSPDVGQNIFCTFCPTREPDNDSRRILLGAPFSSYNEIHLLLLKHKWDFHAELRIPEIKKYLSIPNVKFLVVDADASRTTDAQRAHARKQQIRTYLQGVFP